MNIVRLKPGISFSFFGGKIVEVLTGTFLLFSLEIAVGVYYFANSYNLSILFPYIHKYQKVMSLISLPSYITLLSSIGITKAILSWRFLTVPHYALTSPRIDFR